MIFVQRFNFCHSTTKMPPDSARKRAFARYTQTNGVAQKLFHVKHLNHPTIKNLSTRFPHAIVSRETFQPPPNLAVRLTPTTLQTPSPSALHTSILTQLFHVKHLYHPTIKNLSTRFPHAIVSRETSQPPPNLAACPTPAHLPSQKCFT